MFWRCVYLCVLYSCLFVLRSEILLLKITLQIDQVKLKLFYSRHFVVGSCSKVHGFCKFLDYGLLAPITFTPWTESSA